MQEYIKIDNKNVETILENKDKEYENILKSLKQGVNNTEYQKIIKLNKMFSKD